MSESDNESNDPLWQETSSEPSEQTQTSQFDIDLLEAGLLDLQTELEALSDPDADSIEPTLVEEGPRRSVRIATMASTTPTATLGNSGVTINIVTTKKAVAGRTSRTLYKKDNRSKMDADKLASLMKEGTSTAHKKFDVLNLGLDDAEKLDETYDLQVIIRSMKERHEVFDFTDVFTIVIPNETDETKIDRTMDLYADYAKLTPEQVARSNLWYREWAQEDWYNDNLSYTYEYLKNNMNEDLWVKVAESHNEYSSSEQGGPLFFILMIEHLLSSSEAAAEALVDRLRKFKITNVQGENVFHAVSLLRGAILRLKHIDALPQDLLKNILTVMQTTSVPKFNMQFQRLQEERERDAAWRETTKTGLTTDKIFALAESLYRSMLETDTWTGITTKGSESVFNIQMGKVTCFNCGGEHTVDKCSKPKDQKRIEANRKAYLELRKKNRSGNSSGSGTGNGARGRPHKFRLPEKGENLKRVIDDKPMYFSHKLRRWIPDRNPPGGTATPQAQAPPQANLVANTVQSTVPSTITGPSVNTAATPTPTLAPPTATPTAGALETPQKRQLFEASLANATQSLNSMLTSYTQELLEFK